MPRILRWVVTVERCDNLVFGLLRTQVDVKVLGVQIPPSPPVSVAVSAHV